MRSFATILTTISLPLYALAAHHGNHARDHSGVAFRARGDVLPKRDFSARMTYYDITVGPVACGGAHYGSNDFVVALNHPQFGSAPGTSEFCGKSITITFKGKSVPAVIVDQCMGCPYGGIDLTEGLFRALAGSLDAGVIQGSWSLGGGGGGGGGGGDSGDKQEHTTTTPKYTPPKTTSTPHHDTPSPTPHTTSTPPPPSSSSTSTSTTSSEVSTPSTTSTSQAYSPPPAASPSSAVPYPSGVADPAGTVDDGQTNAIADIYNCITDLGQIIVSS